MKNGTVDKHINISVDKLHELRRNLIRDIAIKERERRDRKKTQPRSGWIWNSFGTGFWLSIVLLGALIYAIYAGIITDYHIIIFVITVIAILLSNGIDETNKKIEIRQTGEKNIDFILETGIGHARRYLKEIDELLLDAGEIHIDTDSEISQVIADLDAASSAKDR